MFAGFNTMPPPVEMMLPQGGKLLCQVVFDVAEGGFAILGEDPGNGLALALDDVSMSSSGMPVSCWPEALATEVLPVPMNPTRTILR
jgi:hypothetical protein